MKLESRDNGKTWVLYEYSGSGLMTKSLKTVESKENMPTKIHGSFSTEYMKRYFNGLVMPTKIDIEVIEAKKENTLTN